MMRRHPDREGPTIVTTTHATTASPDTDASHTDLSRGPLLRPLADWAIGLTYDRIPAEILRQARLSLLDTVGCMVAGSTQPHSRQLLTAERGIHPGDGVATVAAGGGRMSVPSAAKLNSAYASVLELDDNTAGHASLVTVPVGLAMAESRHRSGRDLLTSMVAAYEVIGRVLDTTFDTLKPYREAAFIPIVAPNAIGSAVQSSILMGADAEQTFGAVNGALALMPFAPMINAKVGSSLKPLLFSGWHVYSGTYAALYAAEGLTGAEDSYESDYGGYLHTIARSWQPETLTAGLGTQWHLRLPNRKRHACCGYTHSSIDGMWDLLEREQLEVSQLAGIRIDLAKDGFGLVGSPRLGELTPRGAQFDLPYVLAVALTRGRPILPEDTGADALRENLADPALSALMERVEVHLDEGIDNTASRFSCRLTCTTTDGREITAWVQDAVGRGARQFSEEDLIQKFTGLTEPVLGEQQTARLADAILQVDKFEDVARLTELLGTPGQ